MHQLGIAGLVVTCAVVCAQIGGCNMSNELRPLNDNEIDALQTRATELLEPVRKTSGCDLIVSALYRGSLTDSGQYTVALAEENANCSDAISELNNLGKVHGMSFVILRNIDLSTTGPEPRVPASLDLIYEVNPDSSR